MWIVKLGGSLLTAGHLKQWLSIITTSGAGRLVIVPGGSIFAEHIRSAQKKWQFSDSSAHYMALLAMEQYAHLLRSWAPQLSLNDSVAGINTAIRQKKIPVWLPYKMLAAHPDITPDWNTSSDSLALWLGQHINAEHIVLIKSLSHKNLAIKQLADAGMVDQAFYGMADKTNATLWWLDHNDIPALTEILRSQTDLGDPLKPLS